MRLDQELVRRKLCESRTEAQELIDKGAVLLDGVMCTKKTRQVDDDSLLAVLSRRTYVSRGGEKLQGVMEDFFKNEEMILGSLEGKRVLDIGSSTGGFTDYLLKHKVGHVDAVDVGSNQLHPSLRTDPRISLFENTDIRNFISNEKYDVIVADLSFIPLEYIFDDIKRFCKKTTLLFLLIKPQFEVGKGNTKKGIVRDTSLVEGLLEKYRKKFSENWAVSVQIFPCHIQGGDGNQEYFLTGTM
jgi:23S rRNA (cytidine1920-2'-O)/16S rRNA (cytidine1409-2'-O)-methyltransferase